ncbi:unnamed protein product, partial [Ectocarpus sp. 13 AM-2016]
LPLLRDDEEDVQAKSTHLFRKALDEANSSNAATTPDRFLNFENKQHYEWPNHRTNNSAEVPSLKSSETQQERPRHRHKSESIPMVYETQQKRNVQTKRNKNERSDHRTNSAVDVQLWN